MKPIALLYVVPNEIRNLILQTARFIALQPVVLVRTLLLVRFSNMIVIRAAVLMQSGFALACVSMRIAFWCGITMKLILLHPEY